MTVGELKEALSGLPDDMPVHVVFQGTVDCEPDWNMDENIFYVEGT